MSGDSDRKEKDNLRPRIIRTLGSQVLSGSTCSSQPSSLSQSPTAGGLGQSGEWISQHGGLMQPFTGQTPTKASLSSHRVAQACDRCRSKKTRCDGKRPQCSQCAAVGFECKISDKLSRRAFPRGYTETLEERVRELEAENRRLVALCDLKEEQLRLVSKYGGQRESANDEVGSLDIRLDEPDVKQEDEQILRQLSNSDGGTLRVSSTNLYFLSKTAAVLPQPEEIPQGLLSIPMEDQSLHDNGQLHRSRGLGKPFKVHENSRPLLSPLHLSSDQDIKANAMPDRLNSADLLSNAIVASTNTLTNLNDPTSISFEQEQAPGLPAVKALSRMSTHEQSSQLATLVAVSIPRTTEEILFVPQLLARIGQVHGFTSKHCLYTASLLASLKEILPRQASAELDLLRSKSLWEIDEMDVFLTKCLRFNLGNDSNTDNDNLASSESLTFSEMEEMIHLFFDNWYPLIPIFDKSEFDKYWDKFKKNVTTPDFFTSGETLFDRRHKSISYKIFACSLSIMIQMGLMTKVKSEALSRENRFSNLMTYYDRAIPQFTTNPYFSSNSTSLQSLQLLTLLLFYFLNVGDINNIYELRGKVVSLAQQLRLHRCPSAVIGGDGSTVSKMQQGERRVLFWGVYYLDVFASLQLGVPRLIKDHEIECALPVSSDYDNQVNLAGQMISLEGKVEPFSLSVIRFSKVLGNILDSVFKRGMSASITKEVALVHENALDNWRYGLPDNVKFNIDVNGTINMDEFNQLKHDFLHNSDTKLKKENFITMILYFMAKSMIHIPVVATKPLTDNNMLKTETMGSCQADRSSSSYILLQQAINTFLHVLGSMKSVHIPVPINVSRTKTRFGLFSARASLEYIKGGALFQDNKLLLLDLVKELETDRKLGIPGTISWHSLKLFDMAINLILQPTNTKPENQERLIQKKINYYNKLIDGLMASNMNLHNASNAPNQSQQASQVQQPKQVPKNEEFKRKRLESNSSPLPHLTHKKKKIESEIVANQNPVSSAPAVTNYEPEAVPKPLYTETIINDISEAHPKPEPPFPIFNHGSNSIAEAFQLDPVLQATPFSNTDLASFFNSDYYVNRGTNGHEAANTGISTSGTAETGNLGYASNSGAAVNSLLNVPGMSLGLGKSMSMAKMNAKDGLFKVPSNGDFLKDLYDGMSSTQLSMVFVNGNEAAASSNIQQPPADDQQQHQNAANQKVELPSQNYDRKRSSGYGYVVDASLGLAPLLALSQTPTGVDGLVLDNQAKEPGETKSKNSKFFTGSTKFDVIPTLLSATGPHEQKNADSSCHPPQQTLDQLPESHRTPSAPTRKQSHVAKPGHADTYSTPNLDFLHEDGVISIGRRSPRGPRRHWNSANTSAQTTTNISRNTGNNNQGQYIEDSISDLFRWQNSS
ncbi:HDL457Cp [Eremothecium sinecaudum]|uniref:HDL457Cp n=1 Tax=Eremothecium sinecaudum TaxID=45286 RepID=A0A0X8HRS1_9SACH|nr:HDL457Cp [Eremothecium sinecaudum]AMD20287.1 HDL457Cp [Eremothecium sinecaudum]